MRQKIKTFCSRFHISERGDSGTIYIVFIMAIIIAASYVMVNGLKPEFDDEEAQQNSQTNFYDDPNDLLPPLPEKGSPEYERLRKCTDEATKGMTNQEIERRGKITINCPATP